MILLVDDNPILRRAAAEALTGAGHRVHQAADLREARAAAFELGEELEVLVVDLRLPDGDGRRLAAELRRRRPQLRLLAISSDRDALAAAASEGLPTLAKPFPLAALVERVATLPALPSGSPPTAPVEGGKLGRRLAPALVGAFGVAVAVAVTAGVVVLGPAPPPLPAPVAGPARSAARVEVFGPEGPVPEVPRRLAWRPVDGAASYRTAIEDPTGEIVWQTEVDGTEGLIPEPVRASLRTALLYRWRVSAFAADGGIVALSEEHDFRVIPAAPATTDGTEARP